MRVGSKIALAAVACAIGPLIAEGALLDGYEVATGYTLGTGVTVANSSTVGVTQGSYSLQVNTTAGGWVNAVQSDGGALLGTIEQTYVTYGSAVLKLDVTTTDAAPAGWFQLNMAFQGQGLGWQQTPSNLIDTGAAFATRTVTWDVTSILAANQATIPLPPTTPTWGQVVITANTGAGMPRTFYIDNLRVEPVPEPAMIGLVGLSSLGVLRRRRKA